MSRTAWIILGGVALVGAAIALYFMTRPTVTGTATQLAPSGSAEPGRIAGLVSTIGTGVVSIGTAIAGAAEPQQGAS